MMNYNTNTQVDGTVGVNAVYGNYNSSVTLTFYKSTLGNSIQITRSWNAYSVGGQTYTSFKLADLLDNSGNPFFVSGSTYYIQLTGVTVSAQLNYTYLTPSNEVVGGVRLKSINEGGEITNYSYANGMLYNEPNYYEKFPGRWVTAHHQTLNLNYMSGSHVGYGEVTVSKSGLGKTVSKFKTTFTKEVLGGNRNVCDLLIQGIGNLERKTVFDSANVEISKDIFTYRVDLYDYGISNNRYLAKTGCNFFSLNCTYWGIRYRYQQFLVRPLSKTSYVYGKLTSSTTYEYNHTNTIQPSIVKTVSQGNESLVSTLYTTDYWANNNVKNSLLAKNIKIPFSTEEYYNGKIIQKSRTDYSYYSAAGAWVGNGGYTNSSNIVRPSTLYKNECDGTGTSCGSEYPTHYYHTYNSDGLVALDQKPHWPQNSYTYNRKRLATSTTNGFTKSTTYYGNSYLVSRITNPDGTYTDYEYDKLGRLSKQTEQPSNNRIEYQYFYSNVTPYFNIIVTKAITPMAVNGMTTRETRQFFNNHGRLVQTLQRYQPQGQDIADYIEYDSHGRKIKEYLPFTGTSSSGNLIALPTGTKFTETKYEASPLSRIKEVIPPDWYATKYEYGLNNATDNVKNPQSLTSGLFNLWPADNLFKETVIDGNGNKVIKFTDFSGKLVCSRQTDFTDSSTGGKRKDTYTQYDNKNRQ
jgi:YD repeat-containing protein